MKNLVAQTRSIGVMGLLVAIAVGGSATAQARTERVEIPELGRSRAVDVALDELAVVTRGTAPLNAQGVAARAPGANVRGATPSHVILRFDTPAASRAELESRRAALRGPDLEVLPVVYRPGIERRNPGEAAFLTRQVATRIPDGQNPAAWAARNGVVIREAVEIGETWYVVEPIAGHALAGLDVAQDLLASGATDAALPQIAYPMEPRLVPNDPLFGAQWHLENTAQVLGLTPGIDLKLTAIWDRVTGSDIQVAVVDSGIDPTHDDLVPNIRFDLGRDFIDGDATPTPVLTSHGIAVAGIAAASGDNGIGVAGVAFDADIVAVRLIDGFAITDAEQAQALSWQAFEMDPLLTVDVSNNSWGPVDVALEAFKVPAGPLVRLALANATSSGRNKRGVVYVWSAGNGRQFQNNVNYDGFASSRYTIAVGAISGGDGFASYSEPGVSMLVTAPSGEGSINVVTTDNSGVDDPNDFLFEFDDGTDPDGDYTSSFDGTSASAPMVSGVVALMLERNPNLDWRDVQNILVDTAVVNDPDNLKWFANGSGRPFNPNYGFGLVDAEAAVNRSVFWSRVPEETVLTAGRLVNQPLPDGSVSGITSTVTLGPEDYPIPVEDPPIDPGDVDDIFDFFVEHAEVEFSASHPQIGQIAVTLVSPAGIASQLAVTNPDSQDDYVDYLFTSNAHWGEAPEGDWSLIVSDTVAGIPGQFDGWTLRVYGFLLDRRTVFVAAGYDGREHGTINRPFNTLGEAADVVSTDGTVVLFGGESFSETIRLDTPMRLESQGGPVRIGVNGD